MLPLLYHLQPLFANDNFSLWAFVFGLDCAALIARLCSGVKGFDLNLFLRWKQLLLINKGLSQLSKISCCSKSYAKSASKNSAIIVQS
jgi:hypothetical protein